MVWYSGVHRDEDREIAGSSEQRIWKLAGAGWAAVRGNTGIFG